MPINPNRHRPYSASLAPVGPFDLDDLDDVGAPRGRRASSRRQSGSQSYAGVSSSTSSSPGGWVQWQQGRGGQGSQGSRGGRGGSSGRRPTPPSYGGGSSYTYVEPTVIYAEPVYAEPATVVYAEPALVYEEPIIYEEPIYEEVFVDEWGNPVMGVSGAVRVRRRSSSSSASSRSSASSASGSAGAAAGRDLVARIPGATAVATTTQVEVTIPIGLGLPGVSKMAADIGRSHRVSATIDSTGRAPRVLFSLNPTTLLPLGARQYLSPGIVRVAGPNEGRAAKLASKLAAHLLEQRYTNEAPAVYAVTTPSGRQGAAVNVGDSEHGIREIRRKAGALVRGSGLYFTMVPQDGYVAVVFSDDPQGAVIPPAAAEASPPLWAPNQRGSVTFDRAPYTLGKLPSGRRAIPFAFDRDLDDIDNYYAVNGVEAPMYTPGSIGVILPRRPYTFDVEAASGDQRTSLNGQYWSEVHDYRPPNVGVTLPRRPYTFDVEAASGDQRTSLNGQYWSQVHDYRQPGVGAVAAPASDLSVASDCAVSFAAEAAQAGYNPSSLFTTSDGSAVVVPLVPPTADALARVRAALRSSQGCPAGLLLGDDVVFAWFGAAGVSAAQVEQAIEDVIGTPNVGVTLPHRPYTFDVEAASGDQRASLNGQYWSQVHNYR